MSRLEKNWSYTVWKGIADLQFIVTEPLCLVSAKKDYDMFPDLIQYILL